MPKPPQLWSVSFLTAPDAVERLADVASEDSVALTILNPPRKKEARVEALFDHAPDRAALTARLAVVAKILGVKMPKLDIRETPKLDWLKKVAGDFPPLSIARWVVHGAHHTVDARNTLQIDATSAFGTGEHPTTRGCLVMLEKILKKRGSIPFSSLLDLGCGSGILAMAWAQATQGRAVAVDLDPESVAVARENVRINGLQKNIRVGLSYGYRAPLVKHNAPYDLIMANIFAGPLSQMAKDLKCHLRPGGRAILAGLLTRQANKVLAAHRMQGLYMEKRLVIGEWTILALKRAARAK